METTRKKKMAYSRFAIWWIYFYQIELFTKNTKKTDEIIFSVTQNRTCELPQFLRDFDDYAIM